MATFKRGNTYWYKFQWNGELVRESTGQANDKIARKMEAAHKGRLLRLDTDRAEARERLECESVLSCHECEKLFNADKALRREANVFCGTKCATSWGRARNMPTLSAFLGDRFIPDSEMRHRAKPKTATYYRQGVAMLKRSSIESVRLDELTSEHVQRFPSEFSHLSPSGINMGLRTLRRAMNLAYQWGAIEKPVRVELAKGENQRDRVLTAKESQAYLEACPQPWRDAATVMLNEGMRPGEVFALAWEHISLGLDGAGLIRVVDGKSRAARRVLPMTPEVHALLTARHTAAYQANIGTAVLATADDLRHLVTGWVFPSQSKSGHLETQTAKRQHAVALKLSGVPPFVPYVLRHTALTRLAKAAGGDVFALAKIAGHSSIVVSQKYVHPEFETVDEVFTKLSQAGSEKVRGGHKSGHSEIAPRLVLAG